MNKYLKKQLIIVFVYLIILAIVASGVYFLLLKPALPSCSDGIQNQGEAGIDCGGPCPSCFWQLQEDLEIIYVGAIETQENYVDLVAKIRNPNPDFGAKSFSYRFDLYDSSLALINSREGTSYILPRKIDYVIEQKVFASKVFKVEFKIFAVNWEKLIDYQELELLIRNQNIEQSEDFIRLSGTLENRNNYDFNQIDIYSILVDKDSKILAVGKTRLETVMSQERRYFEINWPYEIKGIIERADVVAKTNVFADENYMRRHGEDKEKFQEY